MISIRDLCGLGPIPKDRTAVTAWLGWHQVPITICERDGRRPEFVQLSDLPDDVRMAWVVRNCEANGLAVGQYDDDAQKEFLKAPANLRKAAERKAAMAVFAKTAKPDVTWDELSVLVADRFGRKGTSEAALRSLLKAVEGVDPINFAPALLRNQKGGAPKAKTDDQAWTLFISVIERAAPTFPIKAAWRDVRDIAKQEGWDWPTYQTVKRRWNALPIAQQLYLHHGTKETVERLTQPIARDKTMLNAMEIVSLDGRVLDFWVTMPDGKVRAQLCWRWWTWPTITFLAKCLYHRRMPSPRWP